ncbi:MAG: TIGR03619 family F420-dependent LLM class oxidoreductase [Proteobacteria bacterium]|nr:TIGR03619 family F420-dependent LLM class oxidoreductase [Pseudomonadota bacterium]
MELGITLRNMGPQSSRELLLECARAAEDVGLDSVWVTDHIAIPPDDAEGSGGRYLDPLATLAYLAGATERIGLGVGVLILPYRPPLPTAKWVATVQELSGGRLRLGVGVGWMKPEFRALGVPRSRRGADSDAVLELLNRCFDAADDVVEENGQPFLFLPRPARPPIFIGGAPPHAFTRVIRYGDGWMPMSGDPDALRAPIAELRRMAQEAGRPVPEVATFGVLPSDPGEARDRLAALESIGVTRFLLGVRYDDAASYRKSAETLAALRT